MLTVRYC